MCESCARSSRAVDPSTRNLSRTQADLWLRFPWTFVIHSVSKSSWQLLSATRHWTILTFIPPVSCDISFEFPPLRTSASSNFSRNGIPSTILLRDSYYCYYLILETNKGEYIGNSIVIVWNFIKVTVDNTRSRVTRRFATMGIVLRNSAWQA